MKIPKIKWVVQPPPTGRYRSFFDRGWPSAHYVGTKDEKPAFMIRCKTDYKPHRVKSGDHEELKLYIADWSDKTDGAFKWKLLKRRFATLAELKATIPDILEKLSGFSPEEIRK